MTPRMLHPENLHIRRDTKYLSKNPLAQRLLEGYFLALDDVVAGLSFQNWLEVGCGEGIPMRVMAGRRGDVISVGLDIAHEELRVARQNNPMASFLAGSAYELPFPDDSFDLIFCCEVMEHLATPAKALGEIRRVGRSRFVFSVPNEPVWSLMNLARGAYWGSWGNTPGHIQRWNIRSFRTMLENHGFRVLHLTTPLPWLMALCEKT